MDNVITSKDIAQRDGCKSQKEWILKKSFAMKKRRSLDTPFTGKVNKTADPAVAYIDFGRWLANCPACGGAEYVNYDEKIFYCFNCGNHELNGDARTVNFPAVRERRKIENEVMSIEVIKRRGTNHIQREFLADVIDKPRNWRAK